MQIPTFVTIRFSSGNNIHLVSKIAPFGQEFYTWGNAFGYLILARIITVIFTLVDVSKKGRDLEWRKVEILVFSLDRCGVAKKATQRTFSLRRLRKNGKTEEWKIGTAS